MFRKIIKYLVLLCSIFLIGYQTLFSNIVDCQSLDYQNNTENHIADENVTNPLLSGELNVRVSLPKFDKGKHKLLAIDCDDEEEDRICFRKETTLDAFSKLTCTKCLSDYFSYYIKSRFLFFKRFINFYSFRIFIILQVFRI
ncbi:MULTISPECIES: hypothetical protein [Flavobacterium]|uniref:Transmembrane protein n=1 Tax=Flavobacterium jumunjinense TaxID=998845 RepID=A0ABV5GM76_9FLAO|nr:MULTISPECIES: hypothetical protein [Flavobacterium]